MYLNKIACTLWSECNYSLCHLRFVIKDCYYYYYCKRDDIITSTSSELQVGNFSVLGKGYTLRINGDSMSLQKGREVDLEPFAV